MKKQTYFKLFTIIVVPSVFFIVLEFFLREFFLVSPKLDVTINNINITKFHSTYYHKKENFNLVKINNFGFHDFDREKSNNNYRIAFIGDSFVEGLQVPRDSLFTTILNKKYLIDQNIEVLPFGKSGTGTAYQYKLWKNFILDNIEIDHVILVMFLGNDLENNHPKLGASISDNSFYLDEKGNVFLNKTKRGKLRNAINYARSYSALIQIIYQRLHLLKRMIKNSSKRNSHPTGKNQITNNENYYNESIKGTLRLIAEWNSSLNLKGINFSLITFNVYENNSYHNEFLEKINSDSTLKDLKHKNIIFPELSEKYFFNTDGFGHFNSEGHKFFSSEISLFLNKNYLKN